MRKRLNPQVKFKVVLEALQNQRTFPEIARAYGIRPQLISIWKKSFSREDHLSSRITEKGNQEKNG